MTPGKGQLASRDEHRKACIEAMEIAYAHAAILSNTREVITRVFDALHPLVVVKRRNGFERLVDELTNPPEEQ